MKAKKSILGLLLIIAMLFSCAAVSYAEEATKAPKFTTSKLDDGEHGKTYSQTIEVDNNLDENGSYTNLTIPSAALTALKKFGITVSNTENGSLVLTTGDEPLVSPTAGYKFKVTATNKWRKKEEDSFKDGKTEKEYTLKIKGIVPVIVSPDPEPDEGSTIKEISSLAAPEGYKYPVKGVAITDLPITTNEASPKVVMTATGLPKGLSFRATDQPAAGGQPATTTYTLSGKPTETGTFKITIKAENADKKGTGISKAATAKYEMNVLDTPSLNPTAFKDVTFGKNFSQKFTVTGVSKNAPLTAAAVGVLDENEEFVSLTDAGYGIEGEYENGKFTISGAVESIDFGEAQDVTIPIVFKMLSAAVEEESTDVTLNLKVLGTAPVFTNKSEAQTAVSSLTKGEDMESFDVSATGPGTITWTVGALPDGITSTSADPTVDGTTSTIKIGGTPTVTAKNFPVDITAKNAKGSTKITLKFTIDGEAPVITMIPDVTTSADEPSYAALGINSGDVSIIMSADSGPVTWKVTKLPKGLNFVLTDAEGKTVNTKTSQYAMIKGKATAAMKDTDVVTVTATDPNTRKSSETLSLAGLHVYPVPTIKTKKFSDVKIGSEYESVIKAEGTTSWEVKTDYGDDDTLFPDGLTLDSSDAANLKLSGKLATIPSNDKGLVTTIKVTLTAVGPGGKSDALDIPLKIKGDAPKFTTSSLATAYTKAGTESNTISVTGTKPMTISAYIAKKDATAVGITTNAEKIFIPSDAENPEANTGFYLTSADADDGYTLTLAKAEGKGGSFKNLGVTIEADNGLGTKATTKVFKATMTGEAPVWYLLDGEDYVTLSDDFKNNPVVNFTAKSADALNMTFKASGDAPMTFTVSPNQNTAGLNITTSDDAKTVTIASTRSAEAKSTKVTMTAKNGDGTAKLVVTFNGQDAPVIDVPTDGYSKVVEQNKKFSLALKLKSGTSPVEWGYAALEDGDEDHITSSDLENTYGIKLDTSKGKLDGTPEVVTLSADNKTYAPVVVLVYAKNAAGSSAAVPVSIGVTGSKPKLSTKTIEIDKNDVLPEEGYQLLADGIDINEMTWSIEEKNNKEALSDYVTGLELSADGIISGDPTEAVKGVSVPIIMKHVGNEAKGSVKITVYDPTPVIALEEDASVDLYPKADSKGKVVAAVSETLTVSISDDYVATGISKISWKASKPTGNVTVKVENGNTNDARFNTAKLTITLPKGKALTLTSGDTLIKGYTSTFDLTATNTGRTSDKYATVTITVRVAGGEGATADKRTGEVTNVEANANDETIGETKVLEEDIVTNDELTAELGEGELTLGEERTVGMLTAGQAAILDEGRFVIAAILPEISATASGQYGLEVDLAETVKPGAKLYWFAFPKDAPDSEDDQIADFFEVDGTDTEVVPSDHVVVVYPWLREGVTYGPVIAVKAEDAEAGEAVTEGELEGAAEGESASEVTEVEAPKEEAAE